MKYVNGNYFEGEFVLGKKEGPKCTFITKTVKYEGLFSKDNFHGEETLITFVLSKYNGSFANGMNYGNGKLQYFDGSYYEGEFVDDRFHGEGKFEDITSNVTYEGEFKKSLRNGKGKLAYTQDSYNYKTFEMVDSPQSCCYEGEFVDNLMWRRGILKIETSKYDGYFKKGCFNGTGKQSCNEFEYEGSFINSKKDGFGKITQLVGVEYIFKAFLKMIKSMDTEK